MSKSRSDSFLDDPHAWVRQRLLPFETGLLDEAEEQRIRGHIDGCGECSERWRILCEEAAQAEIGAHIPAAIMATWSLAGARLQGLERAMVERHLGRCADCREDLRVLGFEPALGPARVAESVEHPKVVAGGRGQRHRGPSRDWGFGRWAMTLWGPTATAAALLLAVMRGPATRQLAQNEIDVPQSSAPPVEVVTVPQAPSVVPAIPKPDDRPARRPRQSARPSIGFAIFAQTVGDTRSASRAFGDDSFAPEPTPGPSSGETLNIPFRADLPELPDDSPAWIVVRDSDDKLVARFRTTLGKFKENNANLSLSPGDTGLAPGKYVVRVVFEPAAPAVAESLTNRFAIK